MGVNGVVALLIALALPAFSLCAVAAADADRVSSDGSTRAAGSGLVGLGDPAAPPNHGIDPPLPQLEEASASGGGIFDAPKRDPYCVGQAGAPQLRIVYAAIPGGDPVRSATKKIRGAVRHMNGMIHRAGKRSSGGRVSADLRIACNRHGRPEVTTIGASRNLTFSSLVSLSRSLELIRLNTKYLIFYGEDTANGCGVAQLQTDDSAGPSNLSNNVLPMYGMVWRRCWDGGAPLHETAHLMGAVQSSAPRSTSLGHCNDGLDILCYNDGGLRASQRKVCRGYQLDCRYNDFFDAAPRGYLASHWNLAMPMNRYLRFR
jgi:hypothetical protein